MFYTLFLGFVSQCAIEASEPHALQSPDASSEPLIREEIRLNPLNDFAYEQLGALLAAQGVSRLKEAIGAFQAASELNPTDAASQYNFPAALCTGREAGINVGHSVATKALDAAFRAIALSPAWSKGVIALSCLLRDRNRGREALSHTQAAISRLPNDVGIAVELARVMEQEGLPAQARQYPLRHAVELIQQDTTQMRATDVSAFEALSNLYRFELDAFKKSDSLLLLLAKKLPRKISGEAYLQWATHVPLVMPYSYGFNTCFAEISWKLDEVYKLTTSDDPPQISPRQTPRLPQLFFFPLCDPRSGHKLIMKVGELVRAMAPFVGYEAAPLPPKVESSARPNVGFLSAFFHFGHASTTAMQPIISRLPRNLRVVLIYVMCPGWSLQDMIANTLRERADEAVVLPRDLAAARRTVEALQLDILVYAELGIDPFAYLLAFSRLATIQICMHGQPATSGLSSIDYFVSYDGFELWPECKDQYTEQLIVMRHLPPYEFPSIVSSEQAKGLLSRQALLLSLGIEGLHLDVHLYVLAKSPLKFSQETYAILNKILEIDSRAVFLLLISPSTPSAVKQLQRNIKAVINAIAISRIHLVSERLTTNVFVSLLDAADVLLDAWPVNGLTTTLESLALGQPIVTIDSANLTFGRYSMTLLRAAGLDQCCIARNVDSAAELAVQLANNSTLRADLRARLQGDDVRSRLFVKDPPFPADDTHVRGRENSVAEWSSMLHLMAAGTFNACLWNVMTVGRDANICDRSRFRVE